MDPDSPYLSYRSLSIVSLLAGYYTCAISPSSRVMLTNLYVVICPGVELSADARLLQPTRFDHCDEGGGSGWAEREEGDRLW